MTAADQIRSEFAKCRQTLRTTWSEREAMEALRQAETVALLAIGEEVCPLSHVDTLSVPSNVWGQLCASC